MPPSGDMEEEDMLSPTVDSESGGDISEDDAVCVIITMANVYQLCATGSTGLYDRRGSHERY